MILHPGQADLALWRAVWRGETPALDPACKPAVEAGAATVAAIVAKGEAVYGINTGFGKLAQVRIPDADLATLQRNIVLSHAAGVGEALPAPVVRLVLALKLGSLAQGASGVRWQVIEALQAALDRVTAALMGVGAFIGEGEASAALARHGLAPLELGPKEGLALLNGTQVSTALALAGLFEAEEAFRAALVTGALSTDAAKGSDGPFDARIHALRGHRGQAEVAAALRALMAGSAIRASHRVDDPRVQDPYCLRRAPGRRRRPPRPRWPPRPMASPTTRWSSPSRAR